MRASHEAAGAEGGTRSGAKRVPGRRGTDAFIQNRLDNLPPVRYHINVNDERTAQNARMRILGIDPGLATLGYGVIETVNGKSRMIQYGTIDTPKGVAIPYRLQTILRGMYQLMDIYQPDEVAFEELFFSKNITTGINVGMARGVALAAVADRTPNLYEYTPMQIKLAVTGYGKADKVQVQNMVRLLLGMNEIARPDDAADALAVALTHAHSQQAKEIYRIQ